MLQIISFLKSEVMSETNIEKEVELLNYRIENTNIIGDGSTSSMTLNDALNLHDLEYIEK